MDKTYQPREFEAPLYQFWEQQGYFAPRGDGLPWCTVIPPPNVTGRLHMGHGFQHAIMDALTRYQRMRGRQALWQVGTDHAGIATQMVVERQLEASGTTRRELGRDAFISKVWQWREESGGIITQQLRRMGSSLDWSRERFTMDEQLSAVVEKVFVDLYEEGLVYRGNRLVNWDPQLRTAISDLEVISEEETGSLWYFRYPLLDGATTADGDSFVTIATTRPETMLGDTAVAVHPDDARYRHLVGGRVELPLCGRHIPIIADDYVDPEFGSGCVKMTPAHDFNDYGIGLRHGLELINVLSEDARINDNAPEPWRGLDRFEARTRIVADLEALGLVARVESHKLKVPRGDRSGSIIEPWLTHQWYVAVEPLAKMAIEAVENGSIQFVPKKWENTYFAWMRNIQDWCISRQLWWGHRIPAWYGPDGEVYVGHGEDAVRARHGLAPDLPLRQDEDVLDTWFSSALWTFSTLGWPDQREYFDRFHPTDVLVTGFDIIFFWVARMIMMTLKFTGEIPFRKVYITGLVRDEHGRKMSKSKGNILDPIDLIDGIALDELIAKRTADLMQPQLRRKIERRTRASFPKGIPAYGADALRFTFYSLASTGRDIKFDLGRIEGFRNFCNKVWNAARFVLLNCENKPLAAASQDSGPALADRWIMSRFERAAQEVESAMNACRFDLASQTLHTFIWDEYCDWYLELSKAALADESGDAATTRRILVVTLEKSLRLLHPFMPFITEKIWLALKPLAAIDAPSIMLQPYPEFDAANVDPEAERRMQWLQGIVSAIRRIRGEMRIAPGLSVTALLANCNDEEQAWLEESRPGLCALAGADKVETVDSSKRSELVATELYGTIEVMVPLLDLIDVEAERARLHKELEQLRAALQAVSAKLDNAQFTANAPAAIVERKQAQKQELEAAYRALQDKLQTLAGADEQAAADS